MVRPPQASEPAKRSRNPWRNSSLCAAASAGATSSLKIRPKRAYVGVDVRSVTSWNSSRSSPASAICRAICSGRGYSLSSAMPRNASATACWAALAEPWRK
nr:hypothetical protein [Streptomyces alfalfae]